VTHTPGRTRATLSAIAALWIVGGVASRASQPQLLAVRVDLRFARTITAGPIAAGVKRAVEDIWEPHGVLFEWDAPTATSLPADVDLRATIVRDDILETTPNTSLVLGRAFVTLHAPDRRPIRVSYGAVEHLLASRRPRAIVQGLRFRDEEMARAV